AARPAGCPARAVPPPRSAGPSRAGDHRPLDRSPTRRHTRSHGWAIYRFDMRCRYDRSLSSVRTHPSTTAPPSDRPAMIDLAVLGLLAENDLHGYELRKRLGDLRGLRLAISFGSLYPALGRLERAGFVKAVTSEARTPTAPMSGSLVGELAAFRAQRRAAAGGRGARGKKVYGITDAGRQRLIELLTDPDVSDDREFPV